MPKKEVNISLTLQPRSAGVTLFRWLYDELRAAIIEGRLPPGSRLPSSRSLARAYKVARGTVVAVFDQLAAEGYVEGTVGNGTFIRQLTPESHAQVTAPPASLSARGRRLAGHPFPRMRSKVTAEAFRLDYPALDAFPLKTWTRIAARCLREAFPNLLRHGHTLGFPPLRATIADYVRQTRGVKCTADQVVITSGTQQSLDLIANLVLDPGDRAWMEDPGYPGVTSLLHALGAEVVGVPVDEEGIDCDAGRRRGRLAKLAYVTPGCQFPLGVTMSLPRRLALLQWASEVGAWIFEDDYDSQLGFSGRPLSALQSLDGAGCVIYSDSFNKMLFPSLRLGFLVVPARLHDAVAAARSILNRFPSVLDQATLTEFISQGHMEQHMRRMRELYTTRLEALIRAAKRELNDVMELSPIAAGLQIVGWLAKGIGEADAARLAAERGVDTVRLSGLTIERKLPPGLVLGAASTDVRTIRRGIEQLGHVLRELQPAKSSAAG